MEKAPQTEKRCDICAGPHPTYAHQGEINIEVRRKAYVEQLKKGKPASIEESREKLMKGDTEKMKKAREKLFKGKGDFGKLREENIRKLREGGYKK